MLMKLSFTLIIVALIGESLGWGTRSFHVTRFGACSNDEQNLIRTNYFTITQKPKGIFKLNGQFVVTENVTEPIEVRMS